VLGTDKIVLRKPFRVDELQAAVRDALSAVQAHQLAAD
jgi:DNA-binding response OmpR family regulator